MRILRSSFLVPVLLFLLMMGSAVLLQKENIARWRRIPFKYRDTLYLPSSEYVKVVSLGYDQFTADFLWLRMIQCFAGAWSSQDNVDQMKSYCNIITDLDPRFTDVYKFAIMAIGEEGKHQAGFSKDPKAIKRIDPMVVDIIDKAIRCYPNNYEIPYQGAFYAFWGMNDPVLAKYYVKMAKKDPNYPDFIDRWEGFFDMKQGRYQAAYEKFMADYVHAVQAKNKDLYPILRVQLIRAVNAWFIDAILQKANEWKKTHNEYPTVEQLDQAGAFRDVALPNWRIINPILDKLISGEISSDFSDDELNQFILRAIQKADRLPPGPYDFVAPEYPGFVIWRTAKPESKTFVLSKIECLYEVKKLIDATKEKAETYKSQHGKYPPDLVTIDPILGTQKDPFDGKWIWDPVKGTLSSETYPFLTITRLPSI